MVPLLPVKRIETNRNVDGLLHGELGLEPNKTSDSDAAFGLHRSVLREF